MFKVEAVIVGAGVIGLAIARALAARGIEVLVLEEEASIGQGVSSRSSEVIHAGLYYPTGSLKAELCVSGRRALYRYCEERGVPHLRCGKLVVATSPAEDGALEALVARAEANGVEEVERLTAAGLEALEPNLRASSGLLSRTTGIVDSHALMLAYQGDAEAAGATISLRTPVIEGTLAGSSMRIRTGGAEPAEIETRLLVNAAGLGAWTVSQVLGGLDPKTIPPHYMAKGSYFTLSRRAPFRHLIYPLPEPGGLGIHLTLDLGGQARSRRGVGGCHRLHGRSGARRRLLRRDPPLLAGASRRCLGPGLCRHPAEDGRAGRATGRLRHPRPEDDRA
jgi:L-2-hydroxyglutarate oxidase LhgO